MLHHGLARAEGAGDGGGAALGDGEEGVDDPLTGAQGRSGGVFVLIGTAYADGPLLHHGQVDRLALGGFQHGHRVLHGVVARLGHQLQLAAQIGGHHDLVEHHAGLLDGADHVAALDGVARLGHGGEVPFLLPVQGGNLDTAGDVGARPLHDLLQGALDAVVNILNEARPQLHRQRGAGGHHLGAGAQAGGLLVDLDGGGIAAHVQDLADELLLTHADHVGHVGVLHAGGHHQRAGNLYNFAHSVSTFLQV